MRDPSENNSDDQHAKVRGSGGERGKVHTGTAGSSVL